MYTDMFGSSLNLLLTAESNYYHRIYCQQLQVSSGLNILVQFRTSLHSNRADWSLQTGLKLDTNLVG